MVEIIYPNQAKVYSRIGIKNSRILQKHFEAVKPETGVKLTNDLILLWRPECCESKT